MRDRATARAEPIVSVSHRLAKVTHEAAVGTVDQAQLETLAAHGFAPEEAIDAIGTGILHQPCAPTPRRAQSIGGCKDMSTLAKVALSFIGQLKPDRVKARAIAQSIRLPRPSTQGGIPLMQALAKRRSSREFSPDPLPQRVLSDLLWAAFGINRAEANGRTAPSARDAQEIDVYAALAGGLYIYDPSAHSLSLVAAVDARNVTGYQDFVDEAPLDLVYVADHWHLSASPSEERFAHSAVAVGAIAENVYLYCASAGLATVVRGWLDHAALAKALHLSDHEHIVVAQTVGYPRMS